MRACVCVHMYACMRVCVRVPQWARQVGPGTSRLAGTLLPPQVFQEQPGPFLAEASTPAPSFASSQPPSTSWTLSRGKFPASSRGSRDGADANCPMQIIWALCKPLLQEELPRCGPAPTRPCLTLTPARFSLLTIQAASAHGPARPGSQHPRADSAGPRRPPPRAVTCSYALGLCGSVRPPTVTGQPGLPPKLRPSSPGLLQCDLLWEKGLCRCN